MQRVIDPSKVGLSYLGNGQVKRDGIQQNFTKLEIEEYKKCMKDPAYFARKYCKVINLDKGLVPFDLYPYQEKMFKHFLENRFNVVLACRQSGKSVSASIFILWYAVFQPDKTIAILANKGSTAREMLSRITLALENLPFFLQPGCKALNKGSITFSNNSRIIAAATSGNSIRGMSISLLYLDEFAFVPDADTFYTSTYPVISSGKKSQVIMTSTINGVGNLFYRLWQGAVQGANEYKPFRVDWWDVPGRDEKWKAQTIANTSQLQFDQEFGNAAIGSMDTLISPEFLLALKAESPAEIIRDVKIYRAPIEGHQYVMTVDVSKGRGQDYSSLTVTDTSARPFEQVATWRDNMMSPLLFPDLIVAVAKRYNEALVVIENNDVGQVVCNGVYYDLEYENTFVESSIKGGIGVTMTKRVKRMGCAFLKDIIEARKLELHDADSILELSTFEAHGDSYEAASGCHDDMAMNLVLLAWFLTTPFANLKDGELKGMLFAEKARAMEDELVPAGFLGNSQSNLTPSMEIYNQMAEDIKKWNML
jgi:hypothetical protein